MTKNKVGFLGRIISLSANNPFLIIVFMLAMVFWGYYSLRNAPLDAIPDLSDAQVIIFTEWPGQSPDLVEDQITFPISSSLLAAPHVKFVRGQSFFGLSFVYAIFEDGTDIYWARSRVLEYLNTVRADLPQGVNPTLGPDATGVGWVFEYALIDESGNIDLQELRTLQDWNIRYALESVPGVAEVASVGGFVKQYQVQIDPNKLRSYQLSLKNVIQAIRESNQDTGGRVLEISGHEHMVRGRGYIKSTEDLGIIPLKINAQNGVPVHLRDVAEITIGSDIRRGIAELDGKGEAVGGIVIMRYGENALNVINAVKKRLDEVRKSLPKGVELVVTYDRSHLIEASINTLKHTLIEELIVVSLIILIFLLHVRSALVPIITLPIAVVLSFIPMYYQGLTANIMSLGGLAVAIGAMVDASIIMIENIHKRIEQNSSKSRTEVIISAMQEVGPSIFFSLLVITVSFIPVFTLEGAEGRLFKPLAFTKTYSMAFAALLALTLTPAIAVLLIRGKVIREKQNPVNRFLVAIYAPIVRFVVTYPKSVITVSLIALVLTVPAFIRLENEFMPPLNEGAILYMPTSPPGMSITEASNILQSMDKELRGFPEVERVFGKMGRAKTATDPAPISMVETTVMLKDKDQWRKGMTWSKLIKEMDEKLHYPGMPNIWWMPIQTRTEMLATGIRSPLGIQVFGDDLVSIEKTALAIEKVIKEIPGTRSAFAERATGGFYTDITIKRESAARYGIRVNDINQVVMSAVGGMNVSEVIEGRERYPINVRYAREYRDQPDLLGKTLVATPLGGHVPLSHVAEITHVNGPPMIRSEGGKLVGFVFVDTGDRAIAEYVNEAKTTVQTQVKLPPGIRLEWAGQFKYLERAKARLKIILPVTFFIVFVLLYLNTRSFVETIIVLLSIPFSLIGAIWILFLLQFKLSIAVWVGIIALAGLDAETAVIMLLYLRIAHNDWKESKKLKTGEDLKMCIVEGAAHRLRPKLMAVATTMIGLLPILWSSGIGADVMKRIAAPMVGGLVTSFLLQLSVYPAIFVLWKKQPGTTPPVEISET